MRYGVFCNNKPASVKGFPGYHASWDNHIFVDYNSALEYARKWLGPYGEGVVLKVNKPWDYSGYGDTIEIRSLS